MSPLWMCALIMFGMALHLSSYVAAETEGKRLVLHSDTDIVLELTKLREELTAVKSKVQILEKENINLKTRKVTGSTYIRWGRNVCPSSAELVYKGYIAGKHYNGLGSGTTSECLPFDPTWGKYQDGHSSSLRAYIYGAEIDTNDAAHIFDYPVNEEDMPCAVCKTNTSATLMIPARTNCYSGWTVEYTGYLMAGENGANGAHNFICMDQHPEFVPGGGANNNEHILYFVEGQCGSLQCPPYVQGRELACVVCSQ